MKKQRAPKGEQALEARAPALIVTPQFEAAMQALKPRPAQFVRAYLGNGGNAKLAAVAAGYAPAHGANRGYKLLKMPEVVAALNAARAMTAQGTAHDIQRAMLEAETGMRLAQSTGNANAFIKGAELRARLNGLLVERVDMHVEGPDLAGAIADARARSGRVIDVTPERVTDIFE